MHKTEEIWPHLFKTEFGKLVSVLVKKFGFSQIEVAQDIASETFLKAVETWPYAGVPPNTQAWLYTVAQNKALNILKREKIFSEKIIQNNIEFQENESMEFPDFSETNITDSQLKMLFTICNPVISNDAQICLALRILGGLGLEEIASALLSNKENIHKKIQRAKAKLKTENLELDFSDEKLLKLRLENVLKIIYLIFNEGYYSESGKNLIREDLCAEAMNLAYLLLKKPKTNTLEVNALMALMCFYVSRQNARLGSDGEIILLEEQDSSLWNQELIEKGFFYLQKASGWPEKSPYYIEASIAYWQVFNGDNHLKWRNIYLLYDILHQTNPSPMVSLSRIFTFWKSEGSESAIKELEKIQPQENQFYWTLKGDLNRETNLQLANECYEKAIHFCKNEKEEHLIRKKLING
ncbi:MAG: RNA polymerase subunit sigma [Cytophagaceae bacterium]|nr:RNA polymerase subunit sigma [Cytophagaceae bacterium]MBL0301071.1 RNA polymerase subunit sigma [Cytophagaceae bacterium]MBL0323888.1 RNA polymerase subunit sigma [Cytophagaceae bacterium]